MTRAADLTGQQFGKLTAVERSGSRNGSHRRSDALWLCRCECGGTSVVEARNLRSGNTRSCGCLAPAWARPNPLRVPGTSWYIAPDQRSALAPSSQHALAAALDADLMRRLA